MIVAILATRCQVVAQGSYAPNEVWGNTSSGQTLSGTRWEG
jgi:hypothetical protein